MDDHVEDLEPSEGAADEAGQRSEDAESKAHALGLAAGLREGSVTNVFVQAGPVRKLRGFCESWLQWVGFTTYEHESLGTLWGHPDLGQGRTFDDALLWWMGVEDRGAGASTREGEDVDGAEDERVGVLLPWSPLRCAH